MIVGFLRESLRDFENNAQGFCATLREILNKQI